MHIHITHSHTHKQAHTNTFFLSHTHTQFHRFSCLEQKPPSVSHYGMRESHITETGAKTNYKVAPWTSTENEKSMPFVKSEQKSLVSITNLHDSLRLRHKSLMTTSLHHNDNLQHLLLTHRGFFFWPHYVYITFSVHFCPYCST